MSARTTVRLDEDLLRELKQRAERENTSLTQCLNQVLRSGLQAKPKKRKRWVQKTHNMGPPLIDITHTNDLLDDWDTLEAAWKMVQGK